MNNYVWLLKIFSALGVEEYIFASKEAALDQLYKYVEDEWDERFDDDLIPRDIAEAITEYFTGSEEDNYILVKEKVLQEAI